jgi:opacity protein-like surface antigen
VLYTMKGAEEKEEGGEGTHKLGYVEIPVLLRIKVPVEMSIDPYVLAGPAIAVNTSAKTKWHDESEEVDFKDRVRSTDFGVVLGAGVAFPISSLVGSVEVRYDRGMRSFDDTPKAEDPEGPFDFKHKVISIVIGIGGKTS